MPFGSASLLQTPAGDSCTATLCNQYADKHPVNIRRGIRVSAQYVQRAWQPDGTLNAFFIRRRAAARGIDRSTILMHFSIINRVQAAADVDVLKYSKTEARQVTCGTQN
jgi:hypothetical protein